MDRRRGQDSMDRTMGASDGGNFYIPPPSMPSRGRAPNRQDGAPGMYPEPAKGVDFYPDVDAAAGTDADRQNFEGLTAAIQNVIVSATTNTVPVANPAQTGALRQAARQAAEPLPAAPEAVHYHAKTVYTANWTFRVLYTLSVLASLAYFVVRVYSISQGTQSTQVPSNLIVQTEGAGASQVAITVADVTASLNLVPGDEIPQSIIDQYPLLSEYVNKATYSFWWSCIVLAAEIGGFILVHVSQQMFVRQDTHFYPLPPEAVAQLRQIVATKGKQQKINIMVCTYSEPMETVKGCVDALLAAPAPCYTEKVIYIGDDGAKKGTFNEQGVCIKPFPVSDEKRIMCEEYQKRGQQVIWVGDRKALPHQLNGKSSNINHMVLNKMYPEAKTTKDIPYKDILMVMDCDHLVTEEFFAKACAVMSDKRNAVCLIPQSFHNEVQPDCFDNTNYNFMFRLMPYYFGAGCCFVTGTNVMIRARAAFLACRFDENPHGHETQTLPDPAKQAMTQTLGGATHRQLFSETLVAEDIDLGSRVHTLGYKSVFLAEVLAKGEVPLAARDIWKQRSRWAKAAHMYILDPDSVFWKKQPHMSFWQKSLYWIPMILHFTLFFAEPVMFTMPILCLSPLGLCPYGIDAYLWATHFLKLATTFFLSAYADTLELSRAAIFGQTMSRVLYFVNVKAVLNTVMVYTGWKKPGAFKVTTKAGTKKPAAEAVEGSGASYSFAPDGEDLTREVTVAGPGQPVAEGGKGGPTVPKVLDKAQLYRIHDGLSKVTNTRKKCLPFEGTLDFWVLSGITAMNLAAVAAGIYSLQNKGAIFSLKGCSDQNIQMVALVFAFIEAVPGLLFLMYMVVQGTMFQWFLKIYVPFLIIGVSIVCIFIELRVGLQFIVELAGKNWTLEDWQTEDAVLCSNPNALEG